MAFLFAYNYTATPSLRAFFAKQSQTLPTRDSFVAKSTLLAKTPERLQKESAFISEDQLRVHGGAVAPRWLRFHFTAAPSAKLNSIRNLSEEIAMALGASDVRLARDGDSLALEVPRPQIPHQLLNPLLFITLLRLLSRRTLHRFNRS